MSATIGYGYIVSEREIWEKLKDNHNIYKLYNYIVALDNDLLFFGYIIETASHSGLYLADYRIVPHFDIYNGDMQLGEIKKELAELDISMKDVIGSIQAPHFYIIEH